VDLAGQGSGAAAHDCGGGTFGAWCRRSVNAESCARAGVCAGGAQCALPGPGTAAGGRAGACALRGGSGDPMHPVRPGSSCHGTLEAEADRLTVLFDDCPVTKKIARSRALTCA